MAKEPSPPFIPCVKHKYNTNTSRYKGTRGNTKSLLEMSNPGKWKPRTVTAVPTDPHSVVQEKCVQITEAAAPNPCVFLASLRSVPSPCQARQDHIPWKDSWVGSSSKNTSLVLMASGHPLNCADLFSLQPFQVRKHQCLHFAQENSGIKRSPSSFVHPRQATSAGELPSSFWNWEHSASAPAEPGKRLLLQPFATHARALQY